MTKNIPKNSVSIAKGLDAMFSANTRDSDIVTTADSKQDHLTISMTIMRPGKYQPRTKFSDHGLAELAESIKSQGIIQPIIVRKLKKNLFEIIAGERRWRAAKLAGLSEVPIIVRALSDNEALLFGIIENLQREDLNPIDVAFALQKMHAEFNMTHADIAKKVGKSRSSVSNSLRLLELGDLAKDALVVGDIEVGHAKILLGFKGGKQHQLLIEVISSKLSVRHTEILAKKLKNYELMPKKAVVTTIPQEDLDYWSDKWTARLDAKVNVKFDSRGRGTISINVDNIQQVGELLELV